MKKMHATAFAILAIVSMLAGVTLAVFFAWQKSVTEGVGALVGVAVSCILAPVLHELGHVVFARAQNMEIVRVKCFCVLYTHENGKKRWSFISPFAEDQTQAVPKTGGNMQKRATAYVLGGLILQGVFTAFVASLAIVLSLSKLCVFALWGFLPYATYLWLINALPFAYPSGKTDALVYQDLKKGNASGRNLLAVMQIQGELYEGKSFSEIGAEWYFAPPQLCEDEPLYAVMLDLRYRYYLEKEEYEKATDCLNRLAQSQAYLSDSAWEKVAVELTYLHSLNGDYERAVACSKLCEEYLRSDDAVAKRVLATYCKAFGKEDAVSLLVTQAKEALQNERIRGVARAESILLARLA